MLVLSRKPNQSIVIGESIKVTVVRVRGNVVSLGIEAPRAIQVMREEIIDRDSKPAPQKASPEQDENNAQHQSDPPVTGPRLATLVIDVELPEEILPLGDVDARLYEPEEYAARMTFDSHLQQYMFAP